MTQPSREQQQFLDVVDRDEAQRRFEAVLRLEPLAGETVPLAEALGRVLAEDVASAVDVPAFDRSNFDGFAVRAEDTYAAQEEAPRRLRLREEVLVPGAVPEFSLSPQTAATIATGAVVPRGADAVVMVEHTAIEGDEVLVFRPVTPGAGITFAGTDIAAGEIVLRQGETLSSRETGVLAAIGRNGVSVRRCPRVAILSTGDELISPGEPIRPGLIYDSNAQILADAVRELGGEPLPRVLCPDDAAMIRRQLQHALAAADVVLLSGGTSKGAGDLCYQAVADVCRPGIAAHGVALKPGKPICLAAHQGKPVVVLPGFPTSAIFTFHEFVAPVLLRLAGRPAEHRATCTARLPVKIRSEIGRTEFLLVGLVVRGDELVAYPMGKGSGSVTAFSRADGFVTIGRHEEIVEAETQVTVTLLGRDVRTADLVVIGSHCVGLDYLLSQLHRRGFRTKFLAVGSMAGLAAAQRGECDLAGMHLLDPQSGQYNRPFVKPPLELFTGYQRMQGVVHRPGDPRFEGRTAADAVAAALADPQCVMVNRNAGSGTRLLIDRLLNGKTPSGYGVQPRNHNAVAAAVAQRRADWGVAIEYAARQAGLGFLPLQAEQYDFAIAAGRGERPAVAALRQLLHQPEVQAALAQRGCRVQPPSR